jgi:hypothetical protein
MELWTPPAFSRFKTSGEVSVPWRAINFRHEYLRRQFRFHHLERVLIAERFPGSGETVAIVVGTAGMTLSSTYDGWARTGSLGRQKRIHAWHR